MQNTPKVDKGWVETFLYQLVKKICKFPETL